MNCQLFLLRRFSITSGRYLDQKWRQKKGLPENPNKQKELLELPDYSYIDGRPVPYGSRQKQRIMKQLEYSTKIIELTNEIDFALDNFHKKVVMEEQEKEAKIKSKLEPKGTKQLD